MQVMIPELSLVVLIGPSGSGKSTFARKHFKPTEIISSDFCRGLVADDENDQAATKPAFEVLHFIAARRLEAGRLTVVDATNVQPEARKPLVALAREYHCIPVALVLNLPENVCQERNQDRSDRDFGRHVIAQQRSQLKRSLRNLQREGFRHVKVFDDEAKLEAVEIVRQPLWNNRTTEPGPFDIIGDVHGCFDELRDLLGRLGYAVEVSDTDGQSRYRVAHPDGRRVIFLGDLVDRGPKILATLRLAMDMVESRNALCVPGNHDIKLLRKLRGKDVQMTHGLAESLRQLDGQPPALIEKIKEFIDGLVSHYVFDDGKLVVAHAGMKEPMQGRGSGRVREFAMYGETTGETDEFGLPIRYPWAEEYRGRAAVVYGHTPVPEPEWLNRTINIDTGCVFGGKLTALRYPERELVSVPAQMTYAEPARPFLAESDRAPLTAQQEHDDLLDIADVQGKRMITTRLSHNVTVREENAVAALEVMSRFAVNPKWLIYLPPTMSPCDTSQEPDLLEHPAQAFSYFRQQGVPRVLCEEKHMGSRAVVIVCRDRDVALRRFGVVEAGIGTCYTRTGRRFFQDEKVEGEFLDRVRSAIDAANLWDELATDWICLDCELMPWSAKAQELLRSQYAPVGAAARRSLPAVIEALERAAQSGRDVGGLIERYRSRHGQIEGYIDAYRRYCWTVASVDDLRLAPFHLLATEGKIHTDRDHAWHMETLARLANGGDRLFLRTENYHVDVTDPESEKRGIEWWFALTGRGGEGMVVKPFDFIARGRRGVVQPAVKVRGREYLRIIYGPEYTLHENLNRLRARRLGMKRSLAIREFALGVEALERFVRHEPLRRIHECVFGVLAMESEPVDPRL